MVDIVEKLRKRVEVPCMSFRPSDPDLQKDGLCQEAAYEIVMLRNVLHEVNSRCSMSNAMREEVEGVLTSVEGTDP